MGHFLPSCLLPFSHVVERNGVSVPTVQRVKYLWRRLKAAHGDVMSLWIQREDRVVTPGGQQLLIRGLNTRSFVHDWHCRGAEWDLTAAGLNHWINCWWFDGDKVSSAVCLWARSVNTRLVLSSLTNSNYLQMFQIKFKHTDKSSGLKTETYLLLLDVSEH